MKASIKFRDEQKPLLRAKIPLNVMSFPFQSGIVAGESKELSMNLKTFFDSGLSVKFSYRPNDSHNPFSFIFKSGIGDFGSPTKSPLTMSAEFNLIGNQNPSFFIHFKPDLGNFSLKKSHSSGSVKGFGETFNGGGALGGEKLGYFKGNGFFPATADTRAAAGQVVEGLLKGTELTARTALPFRDLAVVNFRWGLRVFPHDRVAEEVDAVVVGKRGDGIRLPLLVMNKIGIEHIGKVVPKAEKLLSGGDGKIDDVAEACVELKKKLEVIQAENGLLGKALCDLRSEIAAGRMDFMMEHRNNRYSGGAVDQRGTGDKKICARE